MFERFTAQARRAVIEAQVQARALHHERITPEHVLLGVLDDTDGVGAHVLRDLGLTKEALRHEVAALGRGDAEALQTIGVDLEAVRRQAEAAFGPGALDPGRRGPAGWFRARRGRGHLPFSAPAKKALEQALRQALELKHGYIGSEHVLLGLISSDGDPAARTLQRLGISPAEVRDRVRTQLRRTA